MPNTPGLTSGNFANLLDAISTTGKATAAAIASKTRLAAVILLVLPTSGFTGTAERCSCDSEVEVQTTLLRQRIESQRHIPPSFVQLAFGPDSTVTDAFPTPQQLRQVPCLLVLDDGVSNLVDMLLRANPVVGYPASMADMHPAASLGVFFRVGQQDELDLWFSNPFRATTGKTLTLIGQGHDFGAVTAFKISADGTLRDELFKWAQVHGRPDRSGGRCPAN
jgi:hypothetical protein